MITTIQGPRASNYVNLEVSCVINIGEHFRVEQGWQFVEKVGNHCFKVSKILEFCRD